MYRFSVNFDALYAVPGYTVSTNSITDNRKFMIALPIHESLRTMEHLYFLLNFLIHLQLGLNKSYVSANPTDPVFCADPAIL